MDLKLRVNGEERTIKDADPSMPLLWVLRDLLGLTGTKYSCGIAQCGTCIVLLDGAPINSCVLPLAAATRGEITTIEGLSKDGTHAVQEAWVDEDVSQCGFCQPGQILTAVALLEKNPDPTDQDIDREMSDVLCRCGTYPRIRNAIKNAAGRMKK
ncbi:MAG: (2Fe-2S)-binding protein [Puniceicoccaceae bacterium]